MNRVVFSRIFLGLSLCVVALAAGCVTLDESADVPIYNDGLSVADRRSSGDEKGAELQSMLNREREKREDDLAEMAFWLHLRISKLERELERTRRQ